jgi:TolC family type I secretion outer membrane protein
MRTAIKRVNCAARISAILFSCAFLALTVEARGEEEIFLGERLSLEQAVDLALEHNHQLAASESDHEGMRWAVNRSKSMMLPRLSLDAGWTRVDDGTVRRGNVFTDAGRELAREYGQDPNDIRPGAWPDMYSTAFTLTQPIYNGGSELANLSMSRALERSSYGTLLDTKTGTVLRVKETFLQTLKAAEFVRLMEETLASTAEHMKTVRDMLDVGLRSRTDVLRWEVQEAEDEGALLDAQNALAVSRRLLEEVIGVKVPEAVSLTPVPGEPTEPEFTMEEAVEEALRRHPVLLSMEAQVDAGRAGVSMAWSAFQPHVNFVYQYAWETNSTLALDSFHYWNAGVTVSLPLFSSFGDWAEVQRSKADLERLRETREGMRKSIETTAVQAYLDVMSSLKRWNAARKGEEHGVENLTSIRKKYEVGLASNLDLIDAETALTQARTSAINALYDHHIATARLEKAMGQ